MKDEDLVKEQMKTISKLQDTIRLLKFDISENLKKISYLKSLIGSRNQTINKVREEIVMMKKQNNYENINHVLNMLMEVSNESKKYSDNNV